MPDGKSPEIDTPAVVRQIGKLIDEYVLARQEQRMPTPMQEPFLEGDGTWPTVVPGITFFHADDPLPELERQMYRLPTGGMSVRYVPASPGAAERFTIMPKPKQGAPTKPINDEAWELSLQGYTPAEFCRKLQVPKEDQKRVKSAVRTRLRDLDPDSRAAVWQQIHATLRWQLRNERLRLRQSRHNQQKSVS
jgi:hypothetical protein